jgi:uncharacterized NAD(P)/FAD-binding protein YdhS
MHENKTLRIAIIGGGFSGAMVAVHLLKTITSNIVINLIERKSEIGLGVAYGTEFDCHLLNVPAGKISAFSDDPAHFMRWLRHQKITLPNTNTFAPRQIYGRYIQALLEEAEIFAQSTVRLERFKNEAIDIKTTPEKVTVYLGSGEKLEVDKVVLALGNFPPANPKVKNPTFYSSQRYINSTWSQKWLNLLSADDPVFLIGSGLTALDVVISLYQRKHKGEIYIVSRRGLLPQSHQLGITYQSFLNTSQTPQTISNLVRLVRQEVKTIKELGYDWRAVIDALRSQTQIIWQTLPLKEKRRFLRHVRPYWDIHRHRVAPEIGQVIAELIDSEQVVVYAGRIQAFYEDADGVDVEICKRGSENSEILRSAVVINCTGSQSDYRKLQHPLIQNLLASGLIQPHALNLGLNVATNGALVDANGKVSQQLYTIGSARIGELWETIAVPELREQSRLLAQELLR